MSFSNDEIDNNMNQNQNNSSTITDEQILQIANILRNGLGIQQTQANLDKRQRWSRSETIRRHPSQRHKEDKSHLHCTYCGMKKHTKETCFGLSRMVGRFQTKKSQSCHRRNHSWRGKREKDTSSRNLINGFLIVEQLTP